MSIPTLVTDGRRRAVRYVWIVVAFTATAAVVVELVVGFGSLGWGRFVGADYRIYMDAATRWLSGGSYFLPHQLGGPYDLQIGDVLYPPVALWLFVPFSFLPSILWCAVPTTICAAALWRLRPALWAWAFMAVLLVDPLALEITVSCNPLIWFVAIGFAAAAGWVPGSLALFKPSLFPFTFLGIRRRNWWLGVALLALLSLPFLSLTLTWVRVVLDMNGRGGLFYSAGEYAYALIPIVAWAGSPLRSRSETAAARTRMESRERP